MHAFGDDALGDLDAVGLVDALRAGEVSARDLVEAAIARTEAVNPTLNGLAYEAFDRARDRANGGAPVRRLLRRGADLHQGQRRRRRHADDAGHRRVGSTADARRRRIRAGVPGHRPCAAGQDADVGVRLQRVGRASADRARSQSVEPGLHRGRILVGRRAHSSRRAWCPSRTRTTAAGRFESRRPATDLSVSSRPGVGCRSTRKPPRCRCTSSPTGWSVDPSATPRRSCARPSGRCRNPKLPPIGDVTHAGKQRLHIAVCTKSVAKRGQSGGPRADAEDGSAVGGAWTQGHRDRQPRAGPLQGRLSSVLAVPRVRDRAWRTSHVRAELRPHQAGQPDAGTRPKRFAESAQAAAGHRAAVGITQDHCPTVGNLRRGADADARRRHPAHRIPRSDARPTSRSWTG